VTSLRPVPRQAAVSPEPKAHRRLAALLAAYAPHDGRFELRLPGTYAIRLSHSSGERVRATLRPMLCLVAQGAKVVMLGRNVYQYDPRRMLVLSVDLPVAGQVLRATPDEPYLCFRLDLDPVRIAELALRVFPQGVPRPQNSRGLYVTDSSDGIVEAVTRLLGLMSQPGDVELLGPLVVDEILIRLLRSGAGARVAQMGYDDSAVQRIARAVTELRRNYAQPLKVAALARLVHMSVSSFHQHFKAVTSMSPLQYQKVLRLEEARRLMLLQSLDAQGAARAVGYLSASQFSREYTRFFGDAPVRDVARLREVSTAPPPPATRRRLAASGGAVLERVPSLAGVLLTLTGGAW
jgi:AraC-like DNA-binding protein